jgi:hypothetical protein
MVMVSKETPSTSSRTLRPHNRSNSHCSMCPCFVLPQEPQFAMRLRCHNSPAPIQEMCPWGLPQNEAPIRHTRPNTNKVLYWGSSVALGHKPVHTKSNLPACICTASRARSNIGHTYTVFSTVFLVSPTRKEQESCALHRFPQACTRPPRANRFRPKHWPLFDSGAPGPHHFLAIVPGTFLIELCEAHFISHIESGRGCAAADHSSRARKPAIQQKTGVQIRQPVRRSGGRWPPWSASRVQGSSAAHASVLGMLSVCCACCACWVSSGHAVHAGRVLDATVATGAKVATGVYGGAVDVAHVHSAHGAAAPRLTRCALGRRPGTRSTQATGERETHSTH